MAENINYTEAFQELQDIVAAMEDGDIGLDELSEKVRRAAVLIKVCKDKLTTTEEDVQKILQELSAQPEAPEEDY
ncbi:MAG: exodeoxyribonuclease VII small subunit [Chitinophagaceae bacterium]